jgi:glucan-binding YG repeat protein
MKIGTKGMIFALIYTLILSLLPHSLYSNVVEAAENLQTMELDNPYYVLDAAVYEDTTFLIGSEYTDEDTVGKLKVIARKKGQTSTLIPEQQLDNSSLYIKRDGANKLFLEEYNSAERDYFIYTINKDTLEVKREVESEFYADFFQALENNGYTAEEFDYFQPSFSNEGPEWIVFERYSYIDDHGHYVYPPTVYVHKDGLVLAEEYKYGTPNVMSTINGELFYQDFDQNTFIRINPDGTKTDYPLPRGLSERSITRVDSQNRAYVDADVGSYDVYQLKAGGKEAEFLRKVEAGWYMYENGQGDMWYTKASEDYSYYTFGYLEDDLTPKDVFSYPYTDYLDMKAHGDHVIVYNRMGYSLLTKESSAVAPEGWVKENNKWHYYYKDKGTHKGWLKYEGKWYFFNRTHGNMETGWVKDKGKWYFMNDQGEMTTGWKKSGGKWYLLAQDGSMVTGWSKSGNNWYFMTDSGSMTTGWIKSGGKWYFMTGSGAMKQGWLQSANKWYYLQSSGSMVTGWKQVGMYWYYFFSDGSMAHSTRIGGYKLGASGAWIQ